MLAAWLHDLLRPVQPEPISPEQWRRGERVMVTLLVPLSVLNLLTRPMFARDPAADLGAYDAFLRVNITANALTIAFTSWALLRAKGARDHRTAMAAALVFSMVAVAPGISSGACRRT